MAVGTNPLLQTAGFVEAIDRRDQFFAIVIQQQRTVHQPYRAATALPPALSRADHFAPVQVDVVTTVAECTFDFPDGGIAAQLDE